MMNTLLHWVSQGGEVLPLSDFTLTSPQVPEVRCHHRQLVKILKS